MAEQQPADQLEEPTERPIIVTPAVPARHRSYSPSGAVRAQRPDRCGGQPWPVLLGTGHGRPADQRDGPAVESPETRRLLSNSVTLPLLRAVAGRVLRVAFPRARVMCMTSAALVESLQPRSLA